MNRTEFMRQLERLLQSIPQTEREEALQYYNDYFDDAGVENEKEVMDALGNPAKVAENIKRDLYGDEVRQSATIKHPPIKYQDEAEQENASKEPKQKTGFWTRMVEGFKNMPLWGQVLSIIAAVLLAPALFGIASSILGAVFSLITGWFSVIVGFAISALVLLIVLFVLIVAGILCMAEAPFGGVALIGAGLLCGGIGILFLMLTVAMAGIATPAIFKGLAGLWRSAFGKKEVAA